MTIHVGDKVRLTVEGEWTTVEGLVTQVSDAGVRLHGLDLVFTFARWSMEVTEQALDEDALWVAYKETNPDWRSLTPAALRAHQETLRRAVRIYLERRRT